MFFSYQDGAISKYFNFTGVDAGTWTASPNPDGGPGADQINIWNSLTSSYTQLTVGGSVTLESTTISIGFSAQIGQVDLDDLTLTDINTSINVLSNGDFEDWNAYDDLNDYYDTFMRNIETITSLLVKESTPVNVHSGTYSAKLVSGADDIDVSLHILQAFYNNDDNGIDGQKVKISIFSKAGTGSGMIVLVNKDIRTDNDGQLLYNFSGVNAGKWTNPGEGEISTDFFYVITDDANWKEVILDNIPVPESKEISVILTSPNAIGEYCYFDDISLKIYSRDRVDPLLFISDLDVKDLYYEDTLSFTQYNDSTGIAKNPAFFGKYTVLANMIEPESGRVTLFTDAPGFIAISSDSDGDGKEGPSPFAVGTPMVPEDAVNQISSNALLGIAEDIDVKTTGETLFDFNLPSGYKIINPTIVVECIDSQSLNGDYQLQWIETENNNSYWGTTPAIISPGNQRAFTFYDQSYAIPTAGGIDLPMAINVNVADTGTSGTINVYLFGTLIVDSQN